MIDASGVAQWPLNGIALCTAANWQYSPRMVSDGSGGAIVAWQDYRSGTNIDLYAQHVEPGVTNVGGGTPPRSAFAVHANHPNPFSSSTDFEVRLSVPSAISIEVYSVAGRQVRKLDVPASGAGWQRVSFIGVDEAGHPLSSGLYFYRINAAGESATGKMVISR
jgi:hypothetical protein